MGVRDLYKQLKGDTSTTPSSGVKAYEEQGVRELYKKYSSGNYVSRNAKALFEDYNEFFERANAWFDETDTSTYRETAANLEYMKGLADEYTKRAAQLRSDLDTYGKDLDSEWVNSVLGAIDEYENYGRKYLQQLTAENDYYADFSGAEEFDAWWQEVEEWNAYRSYDVAAAEKELEALKNEKMPLGLGAPTPTEWRKEHNNAISELEDKINRAKMVQIGEEAASILASRPEDFELYASQGPININVNPAMTNMGFSKESFGDAVITYADQMTEDEKNLYRYFYAKYGEEKAETYLDFLRPELAEKVGAEIKERVGDNFFGKIAYSAYSGLWGAVEGGATTFSNILGTDYDEVDAVSYGAASIREDMSELGKVAFDLTQSTSNMLPSIAMGAATGSGLLGSVTLGVSSAGNAYNEAKKKGFTEEQARNYGFLIGASEAGLQYLLGGIGKLSGGDGGVFSALSQKVLGKVDNAIARVALTLGSSALDEASEEMLQTVLEPWFQSLVTSTDFDAPNIDEVLYSGLLGALTSGLFEAGGTISSEVQRQSAIKQSGQSVIDANGVDPLLEFSRELAGVDGTSKRDAKRLEKLTSKVEKKASAKNVGRLSYEIQNQVGKAIETDVKVQRGAESAEKGAVASEGTSSTQMHTGAESGSVMPKSSGEGKATLLSDGSEATVEKIVSVKDGEATVKLSDGSTVRSAALDFGSDAKNELYYKIPQIDGMVPESADALIGAYSETSGITAQQYARAVELGYLYGAAGIRMDQISHETEFWNLSESQRRLAYELGAAVRAEKDTAREQEIERLKAENYQSAGENENVLSMIEKVNSGQAKGNDKVYLGIISASAAAEIQSITGINVDGFKVAIEARQIEHILKRHGEKGTSDKSMADPTDIAKIEYTLDNYDDIRPAGQTRAYKHFVNGKTEWTDTVLYEKEIGDRSYYVVQAVPDTKAKTLYIVTAFIGKQGYMKEASQFIDAQSPDATPNSEIASTSKYSISENNEKVNGFSEKNSETDGKVTLLSDGSEATVEKIVSVKDGEAVVKLSDGSTVRSAALDFGSDAKNELYYKIPQIDDMVPESADALIGAYSETSGITAEQYARAVELGYLYGAAGIRMDQISHETEFWNLSESQRRLAYELGAAVRAEKDTARDAEIEQQKAAAREKNTGNKNSATSTNDENVQVTDNSEEYSISEKNKAYAENFQKRIDSWDGKTDGFAFVLGETPSYLSDLEVNGKKVGKKQVRIDATKIKKIMQDHPEMTIEVIKNLPYLLNDPILVLDSKTVEGRLVVLGEIYAKGRPVIVVLEINPTTRRGNSTYVDVIKAASAYTRKDTQNLINSSNVRFVNENKSRVDDWLKVNRLQLPLPNAQSNSATNSIPNSAGNVNSSSENNSRNQGSVRYADDYVSSALTKREKKSLYALRVLAKALRVDFVIHEEIASEGKHKNANGWYDMNTGEIHIALDANHNGTMLFTAAHELTHLIRDYSPKKFKVFADLLLERFGEKDVPLGELIQNQIDKAAENGRKLSFDEAYEEVVADACEKMLADKETVAEISRELKARDKSLWGKVKKFLSDFYARIRDAYEGVPPSSEAGKTLAEMQETAEEIRRLWVDALLDATDARANSETSARMEAQEKYSYAQDDLTEYATQTALYDSLDHADKGDDNLIRISRMPKYIVDLLGIDGDFYIYRNHAYENMVSAEQAKADGRFDSKAHYHNLGIETMTDAILSLNDPIMTISTKSKDGNPTIIMLLPVFGKNNAPLYSVLSFYSSKKINGDYSKKPHIVLTIAERSFFGEGGRPGISEVVKSAIDEGRVLDFDTKKREDLSVIAKQARLGDITEKSLNDSLAQFKKEVKAFREKNKIFYSTASDNTSNRSLLANTPESDVQDETERKKLAEYKETAAALETEERKLKEIKNEIKALSKNKQGNAKRIQELRQEAIKSANRIDLYDEKLLGMETSALMKRVIERQAKKTNERAGRITVSKGTLQKQKANYTSDRVYSKKDVVSVLNEIEGFSDLPSDIRVGYIDEIWRGLNAQVDAEHRATFIQVIGEKIAEDIVAKEEITKEETPITEVISFIKSVLSMKDRTKISKRKKKLGVVSNTHAKIIETETGIDVTGYEIWIDGSSVLHIEERHGTNGKADQTMQDINDFARLAEVVNRAEGGVLLLNEDGTHSTDSVYLNKDNSPAVKVKLYVQETNDIYQVVECVPVNTEKRLFIKTAYKQKNSGKGQQLNMVDTTLQQTPEAFVDGNATINSIHQNDIKVNTNSQKIKDGVTTSLHTLLDLGKPSIRARMEEEFDASDAGRYKRMADETNDRAKLLGHISTLAQRMKDLKLHTYQNASEHHPETFRGSIEELSKITWKGVFNVTRAQKCFRGLAAWYTEDNALLEYSSEKEPGYYSKEIAGMLKHLSEIKGGYSVEDLRTVRDVLSYFLKLDETYNKAFKDGRWVDVKEEAKRYVGLGKKIRKRTGALSRFFKKCFTAGADPLSVARFMDGYEEGGFYTETVEALRRGAVEAEITEMKLLMDYYKFLKENKKYIAKARKETVRYRGVDIPRIKLCELYMLYKREHAQAGLVISGFKFGSEEEGFFSVTGSHPEYAKSEAENLPELIRLAAKEEIKRIERLLSEEDKAYIKVLEKVYNEDARELKRKRDYERLGYSNVFDGYYHPIRRSEIEQVFDTTEVFREMDRVSNSSFNKNTVEGAKGALFVGDADAVFLRHVSAVCRYASLSSVIDFVNRVYNANITENPHNKITLRDEAKNVWTGGFDYIQSLMRDIQGVPSDSSDMARTISRIMSRFRGAFAKFQLGLNFKTMFSQGSSLFAASSILDLSSAAKGLGVSAKEVYKYCPLAELRNRDASAVKSMGLFESVGRFSNKLMAHIGFADGKIVKHLFRACQVQIERDGGARIGTEENKKAAGELLTRVILETQQNSFATERSSLMRDGSEIGRTLTMFSADAMKVTGRVIDGFGELVATKERLKAEGLSKDERVRLEGKLKSAKEKAAKASVAALLSAVYQAAVALAFRKFYGKDDEDENEILVFLEDVLESLIGGLPIVRDIVSALTNGYDVDDPSYSAVNDLISSVRSIWDLAADMFDKDEEVGADRVASKIKQLFYAVGQLFGIPVRNVYNLVRGVLGWFPPEVAYHFDRFFDHSNDSDELYDAILSGDDSYVELLKSGYEDESAISEAIRKELRENDKRIGKAAGAVLDGDFASYEHILNEIAGEGYFELSDIARAINSERNAQMKKLDPEASSRTLASVEVGEGDEKEKIYSIYAASDVNALLESGDNEKAKELIGKLVAFKMEHGKTKKEAQSSLRSSLTSHWKDLYVEAWNTGDYDEAKRIRTLLYATGLYGRLSEIDDTLKSWRKG